MPSIIDSDDVGRALAVMRGKRSSGRTFTMDGEPASRLLSDVAVELGHRLSDQPDWRMPLARKCWACNMSALDILMAVERKHDARCASASSPLLEHDIDPMTGNCRRSQCLATLEAFEDNIAPRYCRGGERVPVKPVRFLTVYEPSDGKPPTVIGLEKLEPGRTYEVKHTLVIDDQELDPKWKQEAADAMRAHWQQMTDEIAATVFNRGRIDLARIAADTLCMVCGSPLDECNHHEPAS